MFGIWFLVAVVTGVIVYLNREYVAEFDRLALSSPSVAEFRPYSRYIAAVVLGLFWFAFWPVVLYQKYAGK